MEAEQDTHVGKSRKRGQLTRVLIALLALAASVFACTMLSLSATLTVPATSADIPTEACTAAPLNDPRENPY